MDSFSLKLLRTYNSHPKLTLIQLGAIMNQSPVELGRYVLRLIEKSYLCIDPDYAIFQAASEAGSISPDTPIQITIDGKEFLEDADRIQKQRRQDSIRYRITTGISFAAIIIALIALLAQLGLLPLPRL